SPRRHDLPPAVRNVTCVRWPPRAEVRLRWAPAPIRRYGATVAASPPLRLLRELAPSRSGTPPDPAELYLGGLGAGSRPTIAAALRTIRRHLEERNGGLAPRWEELDYADTSALRAWLLGRFAPATVNLQLAALRGP